VTSSQSGAVLAGGGDVTTAPAAATAVAWQRPMTSRDAEPCPMRSATCTRCSVCTESSLYAQVFQLRTQFAGARVNFRGPQ